MMIVRRQLVALSALVALMGSASAEQWPAKPVRIIYPYAAGGAGDATARLIAHRLSDALGQPFIIENRTGANGTIGTAAVARSAPDGETLLWAITPQIAISPVMAKVPYDPVRDFAPISAVAINRFALVVNAKVPARTLDDFIAYVRTQGDHFTYAEGSAGSISHLAMVRLLERAGVRGTNVSYRGGGLALTDVVAGHLPAMFSLLGDALPQAESGAIRILAVSSEHRSPLAPSLPTIAESGFPGFDATSWWGLMAPAGTPKPIVDRIAAEVARAAKDPAIAAQLANLGVDPVGSTPAEFAAMISDDIRSWAEAVKLAGLEAK